MSSCPPRPHPCPTPHTARHTRPRIELHASAQAASSGHDRRPHLLQHRQAKGQGVPLHLLHLWQRRQHVTGSARTRTPAKPAAMLPCCSMAAPLPPSNPKAEALQAGGTQAGRQGQAAGCGGRGRSGAVAAADATRAACSGCCGLLLACCVYYALCLLDLRGWAGRQRRGHSRVCG